MCLDKIQVAIQKHFVAVGLSAWSYPVLLLTTISQCISKWGIDLFIWIEETWSAEDKEKTCASERERDIKGLTHSILRT